MSTAETAALTTLKGDFGDANWATFIHEDNFPNWEADLNDLNKNTLVPLLKECGFNAKKTPAMANALLSYFEKKRENSGESEDELPTVRKRSEGQYDSYVDKLKESALTDEQYVCVGPDKKPTRPPKIPLFIGGLDLEALNKSVFNPMISFGNKYCEERIHVNVVQWLRVPRFDKVGGGEASLHSIYDPLFLVMAEILGGLLIRDSHDSHSTSCLRPDVIVDISVPIFRAEEKKDERDMPIAAKELTDKLKDAHPALLGPMPYFFAAAVAGSRIEFFVVRNGQSTSLSSQLNVSDDGPRLEALRIVINMCRCVLPQLQTLRTRWTCPLPVSGAKDRSPTRGGKVKVSGRFVEKDYAKAMPGLVTFYKATANIAGVEHVHKIADDLSKFTLFPICVQPKGEYKDAAARQIAKTLENVHKVGWCHMDVRWPNIMFDSQARRFILIDCEFASKHGDPIPTCLRGDLNPLNLDRASPSFDHVQFWRLLKDEACPSVAEAKALFDRYLLKE